MRKDVVIGDIQSAVRFSGLEDLVFAIMGSVARDTATESSDVDLLVYQPVKCKYDNDVLIKVLSSFSYPLDLKFFRKVVNRREDILFDVTHSHPLTRNALYYGEPITGQPSGISEFLATKEEALKTPTTMDQIIKYQKVLDGMVLNPRTKREKIDACQKAFDYWRK